MVQIQFISDLHLEALAEVPPAEHFVTPRAEVLVLVGDIGRIQKLDQIIKLLTELCAQFKLVLYVMGNHEFYRVPGIEPKTVDDLLEEVKVLETKFSNLHILNRNAVILDGVCIAGCTLFSQATIQIPKFIVKIKGFNTQVYNSFFQRDLGYVHNIIEYCQKKKLKLVMVTHYAPLRAMAKGKDPRYESLYASDLSSLLYKDKVHTWISGHTHVNCDFVTPGGTHVVTNQKGKVYDNITDFDKEKMIEVT